MKNFNSRPHGGRRGFRHHFAVLHGISTHALTEGDDITLAMQKAAEAISTHALTEGDKKRNFGKRSIDISTHALTEGDLQILIITGSRLYFNSRPHGGRRQI